ncbi:uncharacterized protein LOC142635038 [Castanea sativa]|uniref:uncharacterized protein LOC142635038 n=1 Tax=Castanea sativa TaxID=21020 RepID=UPI003F651482
MTRIFEFQLSKNIEVYIDDIVVKSKVVAEYLRDLGSVFEVLRGHKLHLNASKCSFGFSSGKFLGNMVTHRGIKINPDQIKAINDLQPPQNPKEVQKLTGMTATLNRFISCLVLVRVENGVQMPIYYVSKSLQEAKGRYLPLQKAILAMVDYMGRIATWGTILGAFNIKYMPRTLIKGQVLTNLVAKFTKSLVQGEAKALRVEGKQVSVVALHGPSPWKLYIDGAVNQKGSGIGLVIVSPDGITIEKSLRLGFSAMNNEAEYEALLVGIAMVRKMGGKLLKHFQTQATSFGQDLPRAILVEDLDRHTEEEKGKVQVDYMGRIATWGTILGAYDIKYMPRTSIKGQVLTNLVAKFTESLVQGEAEALRVEGKQVLVVALHGPSPWKLYINGAENQKGSGIRLVIVSPDGITIEKSLRLGFSAMNNEAEYEALLVGIAMVRKMGGKLLKHFQTQAYPQGNGQVEAVKKVIVSGLKKRLDEAKERWVEKLPHVLWTYQTTPQQSTGETPFSMTYGFEAVISLETRFPTLRTSLFTLDNNDRLLERSLDLVDERREAVMVQLAHYQ